MKDAKVQCSRCRHVCLLSQWISVPSKTKLSGVQCHDQVCPRCGCKSFYDLTPWFAWAWASGLIEMGETPPANASDGSGCILFAKGPRADLEAVVKTLARHGKCSSAGRLLVPGVPEAENSIAAVDALSTWVDWCVERNVRYAKRGVVFSRSEKELLA